MERNLRRVWRKTMKFMVSRWNDNPTEISTAEETQQSSEVVEKPPRPLSPIKYSKEVGSLHMRGSSATASYGTPAEGLRAECPLTKGPVRVVMANDGTEDSIALLLSKDMIECLNGVLRGRNRVDRFQDDLDACLIRSGTTETFVQKNRRDIEELERTVDVAQDSSGDDLKEVHEKLEERKTSLAQFESAQIRYNARTEKADEKLNYELAYQRARSDKLFGILTTALEEHQLIDDSPSIVDTGEEDEVDKSIHDPDSISSASSGALSLEALNREVVKQAYVDNNDNLRYLQGEFDGRRYEYYQHLHDYKIAKQNGQFASMGMTDFDNKFVYGTQQLTKALREAEVAFKQARNDIDALGINLAEVTFMNSTMTLPDSNFEEIEGVNPAQEAQAIASCPREWIETWAQGVIDNGELGTDEFDVEDKLEIDDWDASSLCPEDSVSCVADGYWREQIDRWRSIGEEGRLSSSLSEDDDHSNIS